LFPHRETRQVYKFSLYTWNLNISWGKSLHTEMMQLGIINPKLFQDNAIHLNPITDKQLELVKDGKVIAFLDFIENDGGSDAATMMIQGNLDVSYNSSTAMFSAYDAGADLSILCPVQSGGVSIVLNVLKDINIEINENEFVSIVGSSGCGKSTLLRIMSGLEKSTKGRILYLNKPLNKPIKEIGMVFQNYSLMPWLSVEDNIGLGLKFKRLSKNEQEEIVNEYLQIIGLNYFRKSYPHQLSGGMQQRVAIARTLANDPDIVLMDEPFGALDAYSRIQLQKELLKTWEKKKKLLCLLLIALMKLSIYRIE